MTAFRGTRTWIEHFARAQEFTTTPGEGGWTIADTSAAGTPTYLCVTENGGAAKLTFDNTSEAQIVTLYHNDVLAFDLRDIKSFWWIAKVAGIDSVTDLVLGMATEQNDTEDSVAEHAWFKIDGSDSTSNLVVETDDATNDNNDIATGDSLSSTYKKLLVNFEDGLTDVKFYIDGERVANGTTFDMSGMAAGHNVQPFVQLHKASGTGVGSVTLAQFGVHYNWSYGA